MTSRTTINRRVARPWWVLLTACLLFGLGATTAAGAFEPARDDTMRLALVPSATEMQPGDIFEVEIVVPVAGPEFNAYDAYVSYDPAVLTFIGRPASQQEGPLMRDACGLTFHLFSVAPDSTYLTVNHSLLCANLFLTGPGVIYRLQFQCKHVDADTPLRLLRQPPTTTRVIRAGIIVNPLATFDTMVRVGAGSPTPVPPAPTTGLELRAAPNPFNPQTVFTYTLDRDAMVELTVHTLDGRLVRRLFEGLRAAGEHQMVWDGRSDAGPGVAAGVYLVRLHTEAGTAVTRVCLVR